MFSRQFTRNLPEKPQFHGFWVQDKNPLGGTNKPRFVFRPNKGMRRVHDKLKDFLRSLKVELPYSTGCHPGCSPQANVLRHRGKRYLYVLDLVKAYPSTSLDKMTAVLCELVPELEEKKRETRNFLKRYCFLGASGLITGAPASPDLFNLLAGVLIDREMGDLADFFGLTYTRYLDDLTFSANKPIGHRKRRRIRQVVHNSGFLVNHRKSGYYDLTLGPIVINGIGLRLAGKGPMTETFLPRHYLRKINGLIHLARNNPILMPAVGGRWGSYCAATKTRKKRNQVERKLESFFQGLRKQLR